MKGWVLVSWIKRGMIGSRGRNGRKGGGRVKGGGSGSNGRKRELRMMDMFDCVFILFKGEIMMEMEVIFKHVELEGSW
ncbi:hypothetical protein, partial [Bacillus pumilus]|uniref:hypothetical protein n=1 Tax=Bacillus pumilus TaxID=1408 RepID=UPI001C931448